MKVEILYVINIIFELLNKNGVRMYIMVSAINTVARRQLRMWLSGKTVDEVKKMDKVRLTTLLAQDTPQSIYIPENNIHTVENKHQQLKET